jgi:hypothetical protein
MKNKVILNASVMEMAGKPDKFDINVPIGKEVDIEKLTEGDKNPMFVTIEALNEGVSKNKIYYSDQVVREIARKVNMDKPDGYQGHIEESKKRYQNPKSMTVWLGAVTKKIAGKTRLFVKGYVMPYADELKQYLKKAKAAGKKVAVSIYGQAVHEWDNLNKYYSLKPGTFALESIDWARAGSEGVPTTGFYKLTAEQEEGEQQTRYSIIGDLNKEELRANNPKLIAEMRSDFRKEENEELKKTIVAEMMADMNKKKEKLVDKYCDIEVKKYPEKTRTYIKKLLVAEMSKENYNIDRFETVAEQVGKSKEATDLVELAKPKDINAIVDNRREIGNNRSYTIIKS